MDMGFFLGGMLGRVAAPIAQDIFEFRTELGRQLAEKKIDKQLEIHRKKTEVEFEEKLALNQRSHKDKLVEMQKQFELNLQKAEHQMQLESEEWARETFWKNCFPLRNPYEVGGMSQSAKIRQLLLANNKKLVPLRVISALKDSENDCAQTFNANMSLFLANYYSANSSHAIISDIGAWKEDMPVNDASINYLYSGLKGQPTLVIVPMFTDSESIVKIKLWSWGLGEPLQYPVGFNFGWLNIDTIQRQAQIEELRSFYSILEKVNIESPDSDLKRSLSIVNMIDTRGDRLLQDEKDFLYSMLVGQIKNEEVNKRARKRANEMISSILSCTAAMYGDSYLLKNYGIMPQLPYILPQMQLVREFLPAIRDYYIGLINYGLYEGIVTKEQAILFEIDLAKGVLANTGDQKLFEPLHKEIKTLNSKIDGNVHNEVVTQLRNLKIDTSSNLLR